jgi:hypothetical protein
MHVVCGTHNDSVNALVHLVEHDSPVIESLRARVLRRYFGRECEMALQLRFVPPIHIADCNDIFAGKLYEILRTVVSDSYERDIGLTIRGKGYPASPRAKSAEAAQGSGARERMPSRYLVHPVQMDTALSLRNAQ